MELKDIKAASKDQLKRRQRDDDLSNWEKDQIRWELLQRQGSDD